jgi:hypothetical protein
MVAIRTGTTKYVVARDRPLAKYVNRSDGLLQDLELVSSVLRSWLTKLQLSQHQISPLDQEMSEVVLSVDDHDLTPL